MSRRTVALDHLLNLAILFFCSLPASAEDAATADARLLAEKAAGGATRRLGPAAQPVVAAAGRQANRGRQLSRQRRSPPAGASGPSSCIPATGRTRSWSSRRRLAASSPALSRRRPFMAFASRRAANDSSPAAAKTTSFTNSTSPMVISTTTRRSIFPRTRRRWSLRALPAASTAGLSMPPVVSATGSSFCVQTTRAIAGKSTFRREAIPIFPSSRGRPIDCT